MPGRVLHTLRQTIDESRPAVPARKLRAPRLTPDHVGRQRLFALLEKSSNDGLTVVAAPAGYGKTTLLRAWLEASARAAAWLSLDEQDDEPAAFARGLVGAVQALHPDFGTAVLGLLNLPELPPPWYIASELALELADLPDELVVVLDDYHLVGSPAVHALMLALLDRLPENLRLVVASRREPPLRLALRRARGLLTEVRAVDLRFRTDEARTFLVRALGEELSAEALAALETQTEGWAAALRLVALALREQPDPESWIERFQQGSHRYVRDFLVDEVLQAQPLEFQEFLLRTAICERFCAELDEALLAGAAPAGTSRQVLEELERQQLFLAPLDDGQRWYRYHHLFQEVLRRRLATRFEPAEIVELHRRASKWFDDQGLVDEALRQALAAGDAEAAVELVERFRWPTLARQDWPSLERWLGLLPTEALERRPGLLLARAWLLHVRFRVDRIPGQLKAIEARLASGGGPPDGSAREGLLGEVDTLWALAGLERGNFAEVLERGKRALRLLPLEAREARSYVRSPVAIAQHALGDHAAALSFLEAELVAEPDDAGRLVATLALIQILEGQLSAATQNAARALELNRALGISLLVAWSHYLLGWLAYQRNDLFGAREHFLAVERLRDRTHLLPLREACLGLALTQWALGDSDAWTTASAVAGSAGELMRTADLASARACLARLAFLDGDLAAASDWLESGDLLPLLIVIPTMESPRLTRAQLLIALGSEQGLAEAERLLEAAASQYAAMHHLPGAVATLATQALLHQARGETAAALAALEAAIAQARPAGLLRTFVDLGPPLQDLLRQLRREVGHDPYVVELLAAFRGAPAPPPRALPPQAQPPAGLIEGLTSRELEVLGLLDARLSNKEIAAELCISAETAKKHTINIYQKLQVGSRREAVAGAHALGLLRGEGAASEPPRTGPGQRTTQA